MSLRALAATVWVFPEVQMRASEIIRQLSRSALILTPTEKDFQNPEIASYLQKYHTGRILAYASERSFSSSPATCWASMFGSRQLRYEWFYTDDPMFTCSRLYDSPPVKSFKDR